MDTKKDIKDEQLKNVTGGDVTSANVVGYQNNYDCEHRWYCEEKKEEKGYGTSDPPYTVPNTFNK